MSAHVGMNSTLGPSEVEARYQRAQILIQGFTTTSLVQNDMVLPSWIEESDCFWYERAYKIDKGVSTGSGGGDASRKEFALSDQEGKESSVQVGKEYRLVNAKIATNLLAFNHYEFARALSKVSNQEVSAQNLPISHITITLSPMTVCFTAFGQRWKFEGDKKHCQRLKTAVIKDDEALSPNGKKIAFARDSNLWVRDLVSDQERALTHDGEHDYAYAGVSTAWSVAGAPDLPALWSPDSTRLLTVQRDKRKVKILPKVNHVPLDGSIRPQLEQVKVAYPGDKNVETYQLLSLDVASGQVCEAHYPPIPTCDNQDWGFFGKLTWWAEDSRRVYFIDQERGEQILRLVEFDINTGATQILFEETSDTYINVRADTQSLPNHRFLSKSNELIWWSERSGWGHLYLYDLNTGELKHAITSGDWRVRDVLHVDEKRRELFIQTSARVANRDPYYRDICRVLIDTGEITTLLSSDDDYVVHYPDTNVVSYKKITGHASKQTSGVDSNGNYFVATRTRADLVPTTLLADRNGKAIMELEVTDISTLPEGWRWPEPVKLLAADGSTDIYGLLFRPSDFSPNKHYPVINFINSSAKLAVVPKGSFNTSRGYADRHYFYGAALAELGFIVLVLDSRGTPLRSKAFQDESYGWIPSSANTKDHASAIKQLAQRYPYMDINRVGICCQGYRSGLQNFLERQDLYKVCVQMSLLDNRLISCTIEGDKFEGIEGPSDDKLYPEQLVDKLSGKLLLMTAMTSFLSSSYPPAGTFRVIDALQKANKDFDMLILPNVEGGCNNYMFRRAWDYLVKNLQAVEPPKEFLLGEVTLGPPKELIKNISKVDD